jgi:hypothetical protein
MPAWLARLLPHGLLALALLGAFWWVDRAGYRRAQNERDAHDAALLSAMESHLRASEQRLVTAFDRIGANYRDQQAALARTGAALQPIILGETAHAPRLADPALGLTAGLLDAVNHARAAGACTAAASGRIACALPAAPPDP